MKSYLFGKLGVLLFLLSLSAHAQGNFIYDQESSDENVAAGGAAAAIQQNQPIGQSFTPTFSSIGFIRLWFGDGTPNNNLGATVFVNLRSDSIMGPIRLRVSQCPCRIILALVIAGLPTFSLQLQSR